MSKISDFDDADRWVVESTLKKHYGKFTKVELADSEIRLDPASQDVIEYPTFYWEDRGVAFVVFKAAEGEYRGQFCYAMSERHGTERGFDDLAQCVAATMQLHAEQEKNRGTGLGQHGSAAKVLN